MARLTVIHPLLEVEEHCHSSLAQAGEGGEWSFHAGSWLISQIRPLAAPGERYAYRLNIGPNATAGERSVWLRFRPDCQAGQSLHGLSPFIKKRRLIDLVDLHMLIDMENENGQSGTL